MFTFVGIEGLYQPCHHHAFEKFSLNQRAIVRIERQRIAALLIIDLINEFIEQLQEELAVAFSKALLALKKKYLDDHTLEKIYQKLIFNHYSLAYKKPMSFLNENEKMHYPELAPLLTAHHANWQGLKALQQASENEQKALLNDCLTFSTPSQLIKALDNCLTKYKYQVGAKSEPTFWHSLWHSRQQSAIEIKRLASEITEEFTLEHLRVIVKYYSLSIEGTISNESALRKSLELWLYKTRPDKSTETTEAILSIFLEKTYPNDSDKEEKMAFEESMKKKAALINATETSLAYKFSGSSKFSTYNELIGRQFDDMRSTLLDSIKAKNTPGLQP